MVRSTLAAIALAPLVALSPMIPVEPAAALDPPTVSDPDPDGGAANAFASACPEMTDSVYRLYSAFFGREPDAVGWEYWMSVYVAPTTNLESIANDFVASNEFISTYGSLTNGDFVRLVYNNVMGRLPDQAGLDHWVGSLDRGYSRGAVMIAFSESKEYVELTDTWPPLAGYLQWYANPLQFACGTGPVIVTPELTSSFADLMIWNDAPEAVGFRLGFETPGGPLMDDYGQLDASSYSIYWNMAISQIGARSMIIEVPDRPDVFWTAVFYDSPHAADRSPYTDGFGVFARSAGTDDAGSSLLATVAGRAELGFATWDR